MKPFTHILLCLALCFPLALAARAQEPPDTTAQDKTPANKDLPLQPERTLAYTATEGSWLSVDLSPDGTTLVFDFLGDLYTLPVEGGAAEPLTEGMAFDAQPRFSPDGTKVLFVSDRDGGENLWTIDVATKETEQLTKGKTNRYESPTWTPDGKYVVAARGEGRFGVAKLWIKHVEGGSGTKLIKEPDNLRTTGPALTPDGRYIWHAQRTGTWQYNAIFPQYQLAVYDRETGETYTRSARYGSAFRPTISPDGKWLAYGTRHEDQTGLRLRDLGTGEERWLAYPVQRDDQESVASRDVLPGMAFTPDNAALIASYGGKLWRIPLDGSPATEIPFTIDVKLDLGPELSFDYPIEDTPTFVARQIRDAVPSPDGTRLAFTVLDRLYVMDYPDGTPRRLTSMRRTEAQPTWSPDGQWIAFATWSNEEGGALYKVRADGRGDPVRLTPTPALYQQPAWSPDGTRLAAVRGPARAFREATGPFAPGASTDLVWIPAEGGADRLIAPAEGRRQPHFTGDPGRVYLFHPSRGLVSLRWDGTDEKEHLRVEGNRRPGARQPNRASAILMAPVGDQALAQVNNDLYVITVPYLGETPTISVANPDNAIFPAKKLTDIGGQFPAWGADGRKAHWSIGNAHFVYDLDAARAFADSLAAAREAAGEAEEGEAEEGEAEEGDVEEDTGEAEGAEEGAGAEEEKESKEEKYRPEEVRVRIEVARDIPEGTLLLQGARLITMRGDEVIEQGDVLIRNNRIVAVGPTGSLDVPAGADVRNVSGMTIVPGFVDTHAHMWPAWGIHKPSVWMYLANLAYGVTTTRDPQTSSTDVLTYGDLVDAGQLIGPRVYSTGPGVFGDYIEDPIRDLDHARDILKRYSEYYDTKTIKMYMAGNRQQRQWVIMAAREQGLMPTTEGGLDLKYNLTMLIDGYPGQEHSFPIYPLYEDVIRLTAETKMTYTPTLLVSYGGPFGENYFYTRENPHDDAKLRRFSPHREIDQKTRRRGAGVGPGPGGWFREEEHIFPEHAEVARRIIERGGRVGVGSHGQLQGLGYHWELWAVRSGGMTPHDALRAATILGAEGIGLDRDLGSLEPGKLADLVILAANPLENIRHTNTIRFVMKNGRLYDGDTLRELWPIERATPLPPQDDPPADLKAGLGRQ